MRNQPLVKRIIRQQTLLSASLGLRTAPGQDTSTFNLIEVLPQRLIPADPDLNNNADRYLETGLSEERNINTSSPRTRGIQEAKPEMQSLDAPALSAREIAAGQSPSEVTTPVEISSGQSWLPGADSTATRKTSVDVLSPRQAEQSYRTQEAGPGKASPLKWSPRAEQNTQNGVLHISPRPESAELVPEAAAVIGQPLLSQEPQASQAGPSAAETEPATESTELPNQLWPPPAISEEPPLPGKQTLRSRVWEITSPSEQFVSGKENESQNAQPGAQRQSGSPEENRALSDKNASAREQSSTESADKLFALRETDRSPQAWLARLNRRALEEQRQAKSTLIPERHKRPAVQKRPEPTQQRQPEVISQRARTFLKPLLGIDPGEVPIYHDEQAIQATSGLSADALSIGKRIEMASGSLEETPETLGLLAHELTHVARRPQPRFIPPVARMPDLMNDRGPSPEMLNEESLALHVEQRVRRIARAVSTTDTPEQSVPFAAVNEPASKENDADGEIRAKRGIWGNLPAPWEPLPSWLMGMPMPTETRTSLPIAAPFASPVPSAPDTTWQAPESGSPGDAHQTRMGMETWRAGTERSVSDGSEENIPPPNAAEHTSTQEPEQDLDALARQVYSLLKRRLSVEQRRGV